MTLDILEQFSKSSQKDETQGASQSMNATLLPAVKRIFSRLRSPWHGDAGMPRQSQAASRAAGFDQAGKFAFAPIVPAMNRDFGDLVGEERSDKAPPRPSRNRWTMRSTAFAILPASKGAACITAAR